MKWEYVGTGLTFISIGLTLILALPPPGWPKMPPPLVHVGVIIGIALVVIGAIVFVFGTWPALPNPKLAVAGVVCGFFLIIGCGVWLWLGYAGPDNPDLPDVTLRLTYKKSPALILVNQSDTLAREIKWTLTLWNIDRPRAWSNALDLPPNPNEALQIPVSSFDFLRPHSESGPLNLFGSDLVAPYVKSGDRLVGSASVICPECSQGHTFLVYIIFGHTGWFWEVKRKDGEDGALIVPSRQTTEGVIEYFNTVINNMPKSRTEITDPY